jgi:raffinose/stachyose/melibiose transport system substrate-binding protein
LRNFLRRPARHTAVAIPLVAILGLAGCAGDTSSAQGGPVELRLAMRDVSAPAFEALTAAYTQVNPSVTFQIDKVPVVDYPELLRTELIGGNAADLFMVSGGTGFGESVLPLASAGYVESLSGTPAQDVLSENVAPLFTGEDGEVYAQALSNDAFTVIMSDAAGAELGVTPPADIDEVLRSCAAATAAGRSMYTIAGATGSNPAINAVQMAASRVYARDPEWNRRRANGEVTFAGSAGWRRTLETIVQMYGAGCYPRGVAGSSSADSIRAVASGASVNILASATLLGELNRVNPDAPFSAQVFPGDRADDTRLFFSAQALALNASSSDAEKVAALNFLAWISQPANLDAFAQANGGVSLTVEDGGELPAQFAGMGDFLRNPDLQMPVASAFWPNPEVYAALGSGVQGLLAGQTDVGAVLEAMDAAWDR